MSIKLLKYSLVGIIVAFGFFSPLGLDFSYSRAIAENHEGSSLDVGGPATGSSESESAAGSSLDSGTAAQVGETSITAKKVDPTGGTGTLKDSARAYTKSGGKTAVSPDTGLVTIAMTSLANLFLTIVSRLLWLAGIFFNFSMNFTLNLADYAKSLNIDTTWGIVRDLVNITFIFSLLWIAAATVLELGDHKKFLTGLIIAALLINFSLFFTKVIIDISNTIALQFYSSITAGQFNNSSAWDGGITAQFMDRLKLQTIYAVGGKGESVVAETSAPKGLDMTSVFMVAIFGSIFILIAAAVFFTVALMFVARSAVLILLMVTSPIGFIGGWIPKLQDYGKKWWEQLWSQSMLAPAFLMFIWIILKMTEPTEPRTIGGAVATSGGSSPNTASALSAAVGDSLGNSPALGVASNVSGQNQVSFATALSGSDGSSVAIIFNFFIIMAFLVAALYVAKSLSGKAGTAFASFGQKALGTAVGGVGGFLGRHTVGRLASKIGRMEGFRDAAAKSPRTMGLLLKGVEGVAGSSFDVRGGIPGTRTAGGVILSAAGAGLELGKARGEGGYQKTLQKQVEGKEKSAQELGVNKEKILEQDRIITRHQETIGTIKRGAATASRELNPAEKARVDGLEGQIKTARAERQRITRERKTDMAAGIDTGSPETLWAKVARKDKVASAHIQIEVLKKENEEEEKEIGEIKSDIKALEKRLRETGGPPAFTGAERAELDKLRKKLFNKEETVRNKKLKISELETIS